ncbi:Golgin subfamily A member 7/ERF4 family-domain-containing protein [Lipomyces tetrasporus]|uniref:Ras modification protein ERF4 n=1 Tax=Lipomyces tetrasporus TaxID=54092 RepID=A0AAD7QYL2_9ASCO|nr:Golgin subfamily A member 7/ERF4 family-domain-containing protein [Lipomyces tetrasporus]KAJ8103849.1 Golgin subfamily A member 7/ERF4 family-domain-containing protein [Lipomyces tetrasporus]
MTSSIDANSPVIDDPPQDERPLQLADPRWPPSVAHSDYFRTHAENSHVPPGSPDAESTRIVRIHRDYVCARESNTPAFTPQFPGYPLSVFMTEIEFLDLIHEVNDQLDQAFYPLSPGNVIDGCIGVLTCSLCEFMYTSHHKRKVSELESFVERLNKEVYKVRGIKVISPMQTAYLSLDIQVPYPFVRPHGGTI